MVTRQGQQGAIAISIAGLSGNRRSRCRRWDELAAWSCESTRDSRYGVRGGRCDGTKRPRAGRPSRHHSRLRICHHQFQVGYHHPWKEAHVISAMPRPDVQLTSKSPEAILQYSAPKPGKCRAVRPSLLCANDQSTSSLLPSGANLDSRL